MSDKSGHHVAGLKKDDFSILQDGKKKIDVAVFQEITHTSRTAPAPLSLPAGVYSNVVAKTTATQNLIVIVLDAINTPFSDQASARHDILRYLSEGITADTSVALLLMTPRGIRVLHDFTSDTSVLIDALKGKNSASVSSDNAAIAKFERGDLNAAANGSADIVGPQEIDAAHQVAVLDTTSCLIQIANAYAGVPGRKSLIWVTAGVPHSMALFLQAVQVNSSKHLQETDTSRDFETAWRALEHDGFTLYAVDASGVLDGKVYGGGVYATNNGWGAGYVPRPGCSLGTAVCVPDIIVPEETLFTLRTLSEMTGGFAYVNENDLAKGIRQATEDSDSYYILGFYLPAEAVPGWHKLKVATVDDKLKVRTRQDFFVAKPESESTTDAKEIIRTALASRVAFTGLPLALRWAETTKSQPDVSSSRPSLVDNSKSSKKSMPFELAIAANRIHIDEDSRISLTIVAIVRDATGSVVATIQQQLDRKVRPEEATSLNKTGMDYQNAFSLAPGDFVATLVVRDNLSGRIGSVIVPLRVDP